MFALFSACIVIYFLLEKVCTDHNQEHSISEVHHTVKKKCTFTPNLVVAELPLIWVQP